MASARASRYSYRASSNDDVNIAYSADLTALTRLEVIIIYQIHNYQNDPKIMLFNEWKKRKMKFLRTFSHIE